MLAPLVPGNGPLLNPTIGENHSPLQFPKSTDIFPTIPETISMWLVTNNPYFATQAIECVYPISGQYQRAPRYIYYALCLLALALRSHNWVANASLASVMAYSGTAAIHAITMVSMRTDLAAYGYQWVSVFWQEPDQPALPVWPMAWDLDCDPVLAIVGSAFLLVAPMQTWSRTFRAATAKTLLLLWSVLLLMGLICAFIDEEYVNLWSLPQFRFCSAMVDNLPVSSSGSGTDASTSIDWNTTLWSTFDTSSNSPFISCYYPCFGTTWPLRSSSDIIAIPSTPTSATDGTTGLDITFSIYCLAISCAICSITVFFVDTFGFRRNHTKSFLQEKPPTIRDWAREPLEPLNLWQRIVWTPVALYFDAVYYFALMLSPICLVLFVVWIEWVISFDFESETFRHVGQ